MTGALELSRKYYGLMPWNCQGNIVDPGNTGEWCSGIDLVNNGDWCSGIGK